MEETSSLLRDLGIRDTSAFEANGITGSDLLDLEEDDLRSELGLSKLQVVASAAQCLHLAVHADCLAC